MEDDDGLIFCLIQVRRGDEVGIVEKTIIVLQYTSSDSSGVSCQQRVLKPLPAEQQLLRAVPKYM